MFRMASGSFVVFIFFFPYQTLEAMYLVPRVFVHPFRILFLALETASVVDASVCRGKTCGAAFRRRLELRCRKCVSCNPISNLYRSIRYHPNLLRR